MGNCGINIKKEHLVKHMGKEQIKDMYGEQIGNTIENKKL
jgi:hypothetical protein